MSEASENLRYHQTQLDEDGCMVGVSRQAVEETLLELAQLREAATSVLEHLNARMDAAAKAGAPVPVFCGIAALHTALAKSS
jgi:hypothetical protein